MAKFQFNVTLAEDENVTSARVADGSQTDHLGDADVGKFVKLVGDSQYGLCAVGNEIEGIMSAGPEVAKQDGYYIASVRREGRAVVVLDGLQATPGTGTCAVGDYVVCGRVTARGTALSEAGPKVCKATAAATGIVYKWRIVALYGTGAVGQTALIESLC